MTLPLVDRPPSDPIAHVDGEAITVERFLAQAAELATRFPPRRYALNLCSDRYTFSVCFAAVLIAGQTNLLPANRLPVTVAALTGEYDDCFVLTDDESGYGGTEQVDPRPMPIGRQLAAWPRIDAAHVAAIAFTSGSTGGPKPISKPWATLLEGARINSLEMGLGDASLRHMVATVPPQHMYGLETSVLVPWVAPVVVDSTRPFTPFDVAEALGRLPQPRVLVSTPVHLQAVLDGEGPLPPVERVFSATAPLEPRLAREVEARYGTRLCEIYGCSEVGSLARRDSARESEWTLYSGFDLRFEGEHAHVSAPHLPEGATLQDRVQKRGIRQFRLLGRDEDLVNIAGKRASLTELNQQLLGISGVHDGVIFEPEADGTSKRLAALVVAPGLDAESVRRELRQRIDAAFVPRPIRMVTHLPRSETGKLARAAVLQVFAGGAEA